jgi:hypothetical protein
LIRGDLRRKPVSLAVFEGSVRAAIRPFAKLKVVPRSRDDAQDRERSRGTVAERSMTRRLALTVALVLTLGSSSSLAYLKLGAILNGRVIDANLEATADRVLHFRSSGERRDGDGSAGRVTTRDGDVVGRRIRNRPVRVPGHDVSAG